MNIGLKGNRESDGFLGRIGMAACTHKEKTTSHHHEVVFSLCVWFCLKEPSYLFMHESRA